MNLKQIGVILILVGSVCVPIILICLLLGAALNGWDQSMLKNLLDELDK
jgi:hypothetical protein